MAKGVIQSIPILMLLALYGYLFWYFAFEIGFFQLNFAVQILVVLLLVPFAAGAWFILGEPEGWSLLPLMVLLALPIIYLGLLILLVVLHFKLG